MRKTLIALSIAGLASPLYAQIQGTVVDEAGMPISQASIEVVGSQTRVKTNDKGEFSLPASKANEVELHIKAPDYIHRTFHVTQGSQQEFILSSSSIEVVNITGLPMHQSNLESSQPVNVIGVEELRDQQSSSLGEALKNEVGIHSSYYSSNSASPIIRGLDGPRVLVTQNGLDSSDASRVGPDHAVSTETSYAQQVEVLRGPATLFYGSGAIGGVVNVVDDRIPKGTDTYGEWRLENHSVADDKLISASGNTGIGNFGLHADGFWRDGDDYKIPGPAEAEHDHHEEDHEDDRLKNSWNEASGGNLGASYVDDEGFVGISVGILDRQYGIPGHSHGEEAVDVYADVEQTRWQLQGKRNLDSNLFSSTGFSAGYTDYQHAEIEGTEVGTTFKNETSELRWELFHQPIADWRGAISIHYKHSDFEAVGEEAFTPPSETETLALGIIEEKHIGSLLLQLGARVEQVNITANNVAVDLNQPDADPQYLRVFSVDHDSTPFSLSAGAVWDFTKGYNAAISLTHSERTPAASELLSFGPHIGSGLYEVGYLLNIQTNEEDEFYFELNPADIELEKSNNLDISLRKHSGDFGFILNGFFNRVNNFYYLSNTGFTQELEEHAHEGEEHEGEDHEEEEAVEFPIFAYQTGEVDLWGYEAEFIWQATAGLELKITSDSIRAEVNDAVHLPRIPPRRYGLEANYELNKWRFNLSGQYYASQNRIAALETKTDGYFLLDTVISYSILPDLDIFLKGYNLTDEYAHVHSSFLKDEAPLPARNIAVGISGLF